MKPFIIHIDKHNKFKKDTKPIQKQELIILPLVFDLDVETPYFEKIFQNFPTKPTLIQIKDSVLNISYHEA